MSPIKVLVNAIHAKSGGGITYLANMLPRLVADPAIEVHLLVPASQRRRYAELAPNIHIHAGRFPKGFVAELAWEQVALPFLARRLGVDVTFSPANFGPLLAPRPVILLSNATAVGGKESRLLKRLYWWALGLMTFVSLVGSARAIAVSAYARERLGFADWLRRKLTVVHHGVDALFASNGPREPETDGPVLLAVGDLYVQKNLLRLIEATAALKTRFPDLKLLLAGAAIDSDYAAGLERRIAGLGLAGSVRRLGRQTPEALARLYRTCTVFVFPSTVEAFGMPLVEAMASGAAIASSRSAAMPEVLADAGVFFDPEDAADMADAIARLIDDPELRRSLGKRAIERAGAFDWDHAARATADVLKAAAMELSTESKAPSPRKQVLAWTWVVVAFVAYLFQFRGLAEPLLRALGVV